MITYKTIVIIKYLLDNFIDDKINISLNKLTNNNLIK